MNLRQVFQRLRWAGLKLSPKKEALCDAPVLVLPKRNVEFILDTDASNGAIGAVLSQVSDGVERPVAYYSKTLNRAER